MHTTLPSKGQVNKPESMLRLNTEDGIDFVVVDNGCVEMLPEKDPASALKGLLKWRGKPATLSQMDEAIAREACKF